MKKIAVIYWSGTGNTEAMAQAVCEGAKAAGADAALLPVSAVSAADALGYDALALGCPAMGSEQLEETEFEPFFTALEPSLNGHPLAIFGSYSWAEGQWMQDWQLRCQAAGAALCADGLAVYDAPDADALEQCRALGAKLAG